ncbi:MAG TPA: hypothetical protein PK480_10565, partial [Candidatus Hydrogenedentes bacterium]|nr:hypothetical protein [Candidatus Hydrogenedentota bacterium]
MTEKDIINRFLSRDIKSLVLPEQVTGWHNFNGTKLNIYQASITGNKKVNARRYRFREGTGHKKAAPERSLARTSQIRLKNVSYD